jgi:predicted amidohydrolase
MDASTDIIILPELWTGCRDADSSPAALDEIRELCSSLGVYAVAGTLPWREGDMTVNRSWIVNDSGSAFTFYDKAHLSSRDGDGTFTAGKRPGIFDVGGVRCAAAVGYDIRFPEYTRSMGLAGAGVLFVAARWARASRGAWEALLRSAAAASQTYVVACNGAGTISRPPCFGTSLIASPWGDVTAALGEREDVLTSRLDLSEIAKCRKLLPLEKDRRPGLYRLLVD